MIRIPHRPVLAAAFVLLCAACGGDSTGDDAVAALKADSTFTDPVSVRVPSAIRVTGGLANGASNGLGGVARYGPKEYNRINPHMNVLRAAGMLRFADQSRRVLVHTNRIGYNACQPYSTRSPGCGRIAETRLYDYSHTVQVIPTGALGAEWREDTKPLAAALWTQRGIAFTPGWVVDLAHRELAEVRQVRKVKEGEVEIEFTWRWALTPAGRHFDANGPTVRSLPASQNGFAIPGVADGLRADTVYTGKAAVSRTGDSWKVTDLDVWN
jgi:hypothetical protein